MRYHTSVSFLQHENTRGVITHVNAAKIPRKNAKTKSGIPADFKLAKAFGSVSPEHTAFAPPQRKILLGLSEKTNKLCVDQDKAE